MGKFVDRRDGQVYRTMKIFNTEWFIDNFRYNCAGSCACNDDPDLVKKYGRLYTAAAAEACVPEGWRIPSENDIDKLSYFAEKKDMTFEGALKMVYAGLKNGGSFYHFDEYSVLWIQGYSVLEPFYTSCDNDFFTLFWGAPDNDHFSLRFVRDLEDYDDDDF